MQAGSSNGQSRVVIDLMIAREERAFVFLNHRCLRYLFLSKLIIPRAHICGLR